MPPFPVSFPKNEVDALLPPTDQFVFPRLNVTDEYVEASPPSMIVDQSLVFLLRVPPSIWTVLNCSAVVLPRVSVPLLSRVVPV